MNETKSPSVAVIIPVYCSTDEHEQYLAEALESVTEQTYRDIEVILVDDASPRDISPIVERAGSLPRFRCIRNKTNLGHAESRNIGIKETEAELLAFLDHDDLWSPEKLSHQVEVLREHVEAGMVFCAVKIFGSHADRLSFDQAIIPESPSFVWLAGHGNYVITVSSVLVRRSVMLDIGLFDARYTSCDDFDAWLKITRRQPIIFLPEQLASYRLHALNVNYGVDRLNDNRLLTALLADYFHSASLREKLALLPTLVRKLVGRVYLWFIGLFSA